MRLESVIHSAAKPEQLWKVFSALDRWPEWSPRFREIKWVEGEPWQPDSRVFLHLREPEFKLKATAVVCDPPGRFSWKGSVMGVEFEHHFEFTQEDGGTQIRSWIELSGAALFLLNDTMKESGRAWFAAWLEELSRESSRD